MTHSFDAYRDSFFIRIEIGAMKRSSFHLARAFNPQEKIESGNSFRIKSEIFSYQLRFDLNHIGFAQGFNQPGENQPDKFRMIVNRR